MTTEEAIKRLENFAKHIEPNEEFLMAIKVLKQADGDLISRKDTIEWLKKVTVTDGITFETGFKQILTDIEQMPSAEKNEMWIDEGFYAEGHSEHAYRCSKCDEHYIGYVGEFNYCPNCGAKMQESEEE